MPEIKSKRELSEEAERLATSFQCVRHGGITYIPVDYETGDDTVTPPTERKSWRPLTRTDLQRKALSQFDTLFASDQELASFDYMVAQCSMQATEPVSELLIRTPTELRVLDETGALCAPAGTFVPNTIPVTLNGDAVDKGVMFTVLTEWLGGEEEAESMLRHLATALAPHWSAVRYVLLLGDGRNGKSVLLSMIERLFGTTNCSSVTRQEISEKSPVVTELNGKLVNLVYDGVATYLKDSGHEKTLIAGEPIGIRRLYSSELTTVQTNALFLEGLNREPKSSDKSSALQARLVRFWFPNVYEDDLDFREHMLSDKMVGALLALMIDNYVRKEDKAAALAPTSTAVQMRLEHMHTNSLALQFIADLNRSAALGAMELIGKDVVELTKMFQSWRLKQNDLSIWSEPDVMELFRPVLVTDRKSKRINGQVMKIRVITGLKRDTELLLESMEGESMEGDSNVVAD